MTAVPVRELGPGELAEAGAPASASRGTSHAGAVSIDRFLAPDHPFLRVGTWRAFVASDDGADVRVVASLDPRQRDDRGGQRGAIGFVLEHGDPRASARPMRAALAAAEAWLSARGGTVVRCPVQFSTWFGHRVMTDGFPASGGPALFPMEPGPSPSLARALPAAGYRVAHTAGSYAVEVERWIAEARRGEDAMLAAGYRNRPLRLERLDEELSTLHAICQASFTRSWGFSPIGLDEFQSIYRPLVSLVDPEFVRILETPGGEPVGFAFAFPEPAPLEGFAPRFVAKTVAVLPEVRRKAPGIGTGLTVAVYRIAAARGYRVAVHACVADGAYTQRISASWGTRFRTYTTYEKVLG